MSSAQKIIQAAAGNAAGEALYVEEIFSTYLYEGNGTSQTITNGIDLDGEGGLVWTKNRDNAFNNFLYDTERGATNYLISDSAIDQQTVSNSLTAFNSDGFTLGSNDYGNITSGAQAVSWTFRKAPKFFDVVTYTGNGGNQTISHNLNSDVGVVIIKSTNTNGTSWWTWHRSFGENTSSSGKQLALDSTSAVRETGTIYSGSAFDWGVSSGAYEQGSYLRGTSSSDITVGYEANVSGFTYVAYLFAHNDGDGEFGEDADQDIIKCGSFTTDGSGNATVNLGYEPQWVLFKCSSNAEDWRLMDIMRGMSVGGAASSTNRVLRPNTSDAESSTEGCYPTANGFEIVARAPSQTYIYIAIRRGPMKTPESGTEVFDVVFKNATAPRYSSPFVVDAAGDFSRSFAARYLSSRLTGTGRLLTTSTAAETTDADTTWDFMEGWQGGSGSATTDSVSWMFRRAPGFFDVVAYTSPGTSPDPQTYNHNLEVEPELIIVKSRDNSYNWVVYEKNLGSSNMALDGNFAAGILNGRIESATTTTFTVGTQGQAGGNTNGKYIAYLFATLDGISKVGSYTGNGTSQTIDCGFSAGARFVLIKRTDSTSNWNVFDTERGIVAGNDPRLELNTTDAEDTGDDGVDPDSSGFAVNYIATNDDDVNVSGGSYVFLAIS